MKHKAIECFIPIKMFYVLKTKKEKILYLALPLIITIVLILYFKGIHMNNKEFEIKILLSDNINTLISVMALFISFSMAYFSLLVSSSSKNIEELKTRTSIDYEFNNNPVYLFQILITDLTYSIFAEIILLIILFIEKFIIIVSSNISIYIQLIVNQILLIHILMILIRNIKNVYLTFWKPN